MSQAELIAEDGGVGDPLQRHAPIAGRRDRSALLDLARLDRGRFVGVPPSAGDIWLNGNSEESSGKVVFTPGPKGMPMSVAGPRLQGDAATVARQRVHVRPGSISRDRGQAATFRAEPTGCRTRAHPGD